MLHLPPLDSLRFFEAAARHQSFVLAGKELGVTAAAVAHRIRRRPPHPHPGEASGRRALRETAPQRAPQRQGPGLSQGGAAHPGRGPRRLRATALDPPARAHRLGRGGGREVAAAEARLVQGGPSRHRHRARDQPPERRPGAARLRRLARLFGRDLRAAPADPARGHAAGGDPLRGGAAAGVQPGAAGRPRPAPQPGRSCATGRCSTISAGTPTGPTGSPARASPPRTSRGPRASASTRC